MTELITLGMAVKRSRAPLLKTIQRVAILLPDFLVPAISCTTSRCFSSSSPCASRVGSAPLSLPSEVNLRLLEPPVKRKKSITRIEPPKVLEIEGPLGKNIHCYYAKNCTDRLIGKMSLHLPPYMGFKYNDETRKAALEVVDQTIRKQREMWGMLYDPLLR